MISLVLEGRVWIDFLYFFLDRAAQINTFILMYKLCSKKTKVKPFFLAFFSSLFWFYVCNFLVAVVSLLSN